tara:strand:- start:590 stop:853 length:264 start_codon:yes stop_codon:yes gene_type:complete
MEETIKKNKKHKYEGYREALFKARQFEFVRECDSQDTFSAYQAKVLLDPLFWQALKTKEDWRNVWHDFIDHLADGKDVDSFFNNLLK